MRILSLLAIIAATATPVLAHYDVGDRQELAVLTGTDSKDRVDQAKLTDFATPVATPQQTNTTGSKRDR